MRERHVVVPLAVTRLPAIRIVSAVICYCALSRPQPIMLINKIPQTPVGADLSCTPPIMCFQKLNWIIEEALAAHRPISYSALFFETALSAFVGWSAIPLLLYNRIIDLSLLFPILFTPYIY